MNPLDPRGTAIHADLHQVAMAAACWDHGITQRATFEITLQSLPPGQGYLVASGLDPVLQYLLDFRYDKEQIGFLRNLYWLSPVRQEFWAFLADTRFTGDLWAAPEGTPVFPGEPFLRVSAPVTEALLVESYLVALLSFSSAVATRTARLLEAARGKPVVDFGPRATAAPAAALIAARAAYASGAAGSSDTGAGLESGVPAFSSSTPSFVLAFPSESEALRAWQSVFHETATLTLGTHQPLAAARMLVELGLSVRAVRLDAGDGDLAVLAREVRAILDGGGLQGVKIAACGDLDEATVAALSEAAAPIDLYGVEGGIGDPGRDGRPRLSFDLVEMEGIDGGRLPRMRRSLAFGTWPGVKQVYRSFGVDGRARRDLVALASEKQLGAPVLQQWLQDGATTVSRPGLESIRAYTEKALSTLPPAARRLVQPEPLGVERSPALMALRTELGQESVG